MSPTTHTAFFYGTLMAPPVLHRVIYGTPTPPTPAHASLLHIQPALLPAHKRHKVLNADYPAIIPSPSSTVRGTLVSGLTDADIWRLDLFEGREYERRRVGVRVLLLAQGKGGEEGGGEDGEGEGMGEGEEVEAETYIWVAGESRLEAEEWDFRIFVREKMGRWVGAGAGAGAGGAEEVDEGFRDVDNAVAAAAAHDPTGGRGANGSISRQLDDQRGGADNNEDAKILQSAV